MELLNQEELRSIAKQCGYSNVLTYRTEEFTEKVIGYLGDHLKLIMEVGSAERRSYLYLFIKCMPRFDKWMERYIIEANFFRREHAMLGKLFKEFKSYDGLKKWRPQVLFVKENIFVFENVLQLGYEMPYHRDTLDFNALRASVKTLATFHAQSYIHEEKRSQELGRQYRIWEEYSEYLQEPTQGNKWRNAGCDAVIEFLKVYSKYNCRDNFSNKIELIIPMLFDSAFKLTQPTTECRNAVVHRDLWANNIFLKKLNDSDYHALFVDYQTVLYTSPMLDLTSLLYFNTNRETRDRHTEQLIDIYYERLSKTLLAEDINVSNVIEKDALIKSFNDNIMFGITQAAIIIPIIAMDANKREEIFCNPDICRQVNEVSRSKEFIEIAKYDSMYRSRVIELLDEIVLRYIYPAI